MIWTKIKDNCTEGFVKTKWYVVLIEASEQKARNLFYNSFGKNPDHISCNCCGIDFTVKEFVNLKQATGFERNCPYVLQNIDAVSGKVIPLPDNIKNNRYVELGENPPTGYTIIAPSIGKYSSLEEFTKETDNLIIYNKNNQWITNKNCSLEELLNNNSKKEPAVCKCGYVS